MENSPLLVSRGLTRVLSDLAEMGYDAKWGVVGAHHAGAPHKRERIWILADSSIQGLQGGEQLGACGEERNRTEAHGSAAERRCSWWDEDPADVPDTDKQRLQAGKYDGNNGIQTKEQEDDCSKAESCGNGTESEGNGSKPVMGRVAHGVADRTHRLKAIGNGQVPIVVALAWEILMGGGPEPEEEE